MNNWNYIGVFLDEESRKKMLEMFGDNIPDGWKTICHHMTLAYNNGSNEVNEMYDYYQPRLGEKVTLTIARAGFSDKAFAVGVNWNDRIINKIPHITIAISPTGKAVDSNYITEWTNLPFPMEFSGTINVFNKNR